MLVWLDGCWSEKDVVINGNETASVVKLLSPSELGILFKILMGSDETLQRTYYLVRCRSLVFDFILLFLVTVIEESKA